MTGSLRRSIIVALAAAACLAVFVPGALAQDRVVGRRTPTTSSS